MAMRKPILQKIWHLLPGDSFDKGEYLHLPVYSAVVIWEDEENKTSGYLKTSNEFYVIHNGRGWSVRRRGIIWTTDIHNMHRYPRHFPKED